MRLLPCFTVLLVTGAIEGQLDSTGLGNEVCTGTGPIQLLTHKSSTDRYYSWFSQETNICVVVKFRSTGMGDNAHESSDKAIDICHNVGQPLCLTFHTMGILNQLASNKEFTDSAVGKYFAIGTFLLVQNASSTVLQCNNPKLIGIGTLDPRLLELNFSIELVNPVKNGTKMLLKKNVLGWQLVQESQAINNTNANLICQIDIYSVDTMEALSAGRGNRIHRNATIEKSTTENTSLSQSNSKTKEIATTKRPVTPSTEPIVTIPTSTGLGDPASIAKTSSRPVFTDGSNPRNTKSLSSRVKPVAHESTDSSVVEDEVGGDMVLTAIGSVAGVMIFLVFLVIVSIKVLGRRTPPPDLCLTRAEHEAMMRKNKPDPDMVMLMRLHESPSVDAVEENNFMQDKLAHEKKKTDKPQSIREKDTISQRKRKKGEIKEKTPQ